MKTLLILMTLLMSLSTFAAPKMKCFAARPLSWNGESEREISTNGIGDHYKFECLDKKGHEYVVELKGIGVSLEAVGDDGKGFTIACPFTKQKNMYGTYRGVRLVASGFLSLGGGISFKKGNVCFVSQIGVALGATAVVDKMTIKDKWTGEDYVETVIVR